MRRFSREQWEEIVKEQAASGLSIVAFCGQKEISPHTFYVWRQRFAERAGNPPAERQRNGTASKRAADAAFIPVTVKGLSTVGIELPCGATVQVPSDEDSLRRVFSALLAAGAKPA